MRGWRRNAGEKLEIEMNETVLRISIRIHTRYRGVAVWDGMRLVGD